MTRINYRVFFNSILYFFGALPPSWMSDAGVASLLTSCFRGCPLTRRIYYILNSGFLLSLEGDYGRRGSSPSCKHSSLRLQNICRAEETMWACPPPPLSGYLHEVVRQWRRPSAVLWATAANANRRLDANTRAGRLGAPRSSGSSPAGNAALSPWSKVGTAVNQNSRKARDERKMETRMSVNVDLFWNISEGNTAHFTSLHLFNSVWKPSKMVYN